MNRVGFVPSSAEQQKINVACRQHMIALETSDSPRDLAPVSVHPSGSRCCRANPENDGFAAASRQSMSLIVLARIRE
jgi:hypothetical protein